MAHRTRIRTNLAAWSLGSAILPAELDALDAAQFAEIDGDAGGAWSPAAKISIGGQGLVTTGPGGAYGSSDFSAATQAQNWPERASVTVSTSLNFRVLLCYDGTNYIAAGDGAVSATSADGAVWTGRGGAGASVPSSLAPGVVGGVPGILMTDSNSPGIYKSLDSGVSWTTSGALASASASYDLVYSTSLGLWVVATFGGINTSSDGATWTNRTVPSGWIGKTPRKIAWNGSLFVVISHSSYNKVLTSPDGVTWTERTLPAAGIWNALAWSDYDSMWMIISSTGQVCKSSDGLTWVAVVSLPFGCNDLANINSLWVAPTIAGANGGIIWSVDQGASWRGKPVGTHDIVTNGYQRIITAHHRFVMARSFATTLDFALSLSSS